MSNKTALLTCPKHGPTRPLTGPGSKFFISYSEVVAFLVFVNEMATSIDKVIDILGTVPTDDPSKVKDKPTQLSTAELGARAELRSHQQVFFQMLLCRFIDNFVAYVSDLLAAVLKTKPELLRSQETIKLDVLLKYKTMEEVVDHLAEEKVHELSYQGMRKISEYIADRLGLDLFVDAVKLDAVVEWLEIRNLIVHNRGVVNRIFLSRLPNYKAKLGDTISLDGKMIYGTSDVLSEVVQSLDERAAVKFGLPRSTAGPTEIPRTE